MARKSGQQRVNELFRRAQGRPVSRTAVLTVVTRPGDPMKRVRYNGGARDQLRPEGIVIFGGYASHQAGGPCSRPALGRRRRIRQRPARPAPRPSRRRPMGQPGRRRLGAGAAFRPAGNRTAAAQYLTLTAAGSRSLPSFGVGERGLPAHKCGPGGKRWGPRSGRGLACFLPTAAPLGAVTDGEDGLRGMPPGAGDEGAGRRCSGGGRRWGDGVVASLEAGTVMSRPPAGTAVAVHGFRYGRWRWTIPGRDRDRSRRGGCGR